ncbi:MAG: phospholipid methyltransferase, partial [Brucella intermedia]
MPFPARICSVYPSCLASGWHRPTVPEAPAYFT